MSANPQCTRLPMLHWALFVGLLAVTGCSTRQNEAPSSVFDAGPILSTVTPELVHEFRAANTTDRTIQILGEQHSCGCSDVEVARRSLKRGESTPVRVRIRVPSGNTEQLITCIVRTDHPTLPDWTHRVRFKSLANRVFPSRIDLGTFSSVADPKEKPLRVRSNKEAWLELYALRRESLPEPLEVTASPGVLVNLDPQAQIEELPGGAWLARHRLSVSLDDDAEQSQTPESLPITITLRDGDRVQATVAWRMVGPIACAPDAIHFGILSRSDLPKITTVLVKSTVDQPVELVSADFGPHLEVTGLKGGFSKLHKIECALVDLSDNPSRVLSGTVTLKTQSASIPEIRIPWSAFVREEIVQ